MIAILLGLLLLPADIEQAERDYRAGRFEEALAGYRAALAEPDIASGPVLYNLGNCAFRLGHHAEALLYYRKAQLRMPRDAKLRFNLHLTEQELGLDDPASQSFGAAVVALVDAFTPGELLALVAALQGIGLVGLVLLRRRRTARRAMVLLVLLALAGAARLVHTQWFAGPPAGVVLERELALRSEPHDDREILFELRAGETVQIEELSEHWLRIAHPRGSGWAARAGVGIID